MPLRKLWNSIRGRSVNSLAVKQQGVAHPNDAGTPQLPVPDAPVAEADSPLPAADVQVRKSRQAGSKPPKAKVSREDKKLCRRIEALAGQTAVQSVVEVGVGDGKRALSIVSTLTHRGHSVPISYIAIDEFELGGGGLTLRDFHRQLREYPAKAQLVPMPCDAGLDRVARTFGQVDVIVWGSEQLPTSQQQNSIKRLCKPNTVVLYQEDGNWCESRSIPLAITPNRQAA